MLVGTHIRQATKKFVGEEAKHKIGATKLLVRMRYPKGEKRSPLGGLNL
jgi:hypothetical protein